MSVMSEHEKQELLNEARVFALAAPVLLPILEKRKRIAYETLIRDHKAGETNNVALVAQLAVIWDIENEIKQKEATFNSINNSMEKRK